MDHELDRMAELHKAERKCLLEAQINELKDTLNQVERAGLKAAIRMEMQTFETVR